MTELFQKATEFVQRRIPCALCTVVRTAGSVPRHPGSKMLVDGNGVLLAGTIGGGAMENRILQESRRCIAEGKPRLISLKLTDPAAGDPGVCGGTLEIFIEPLLTQPTLLIIGAGHVGRALTHLAKWCGFHVILADDRPELCNAEACPGADEYLSAPVSETLAQISLTSQTCVAMVTRGYPLDVDLLPALLRAPLAYLGVIGSERRWLTASKALREKGIGDADLARVHAPIGIEIGAETPEEIAVSIMAEIVRVSRKS